MRHFAANTLALVACGWTLNCAPAVVAEVTPEKITASAQSHVNEDKYGAMGMKTHCNEFVRDIVEELLAQSRPEMQGQANAQATQLASSSDWEDLGFSQDQPAVFAKAQDLANQGVIVLVTYKNPTPEGHGHIAIVVPAAATEQSSAWAMKVPFIAQAGPKNPRNMPTEADTSVFASLKLSWGFAHNKAPAMQVFRFKGN